MKGQDILSVLVTFAVGFFMGGYFYLTNAAGLGTKLATPDAEKVNEFVIVADVYGGCRQTCPSFQVQHDGTYRYLYTPSAGAEKIIRKGELPGEVRRSLEALLTKEALTAQAKVITPAVCNSYTDGIDVRYDITIAGEQFRLDSCGTAVEPESELWLALGDIWTYFETGEK